MMRSSVAAVAAAMLWATVARAQDPQNGNPSSGDPAASPTSSGATVSSDARAPAEAPVERGTGGSGSVSTQGYGYGYQQSYPLPSDTPPMNAPPAGRQEEVEQELRGVSVMVGGGVEGYTGSLAPRVAVGPAWNLLIDFHPTSVFGIELAYVGALNGVKYGNFGLGAQQGADIIRNGGHAAVTFAFGPWLVRPFILAGVGVNHYSVSDNAKAVGFSSTTAGYIPLGGGIQGRVGAMTVDLRGTWSLPFSDNLFPGGTGQNTLGLSTGNYGRWNATLNIGGSW